MENILNTIKTLLGINSDDTSFDNELVVYINSVFFSLGQLGFEEGLIVTSTTLWSVILIGRTYLESVKTYVYLKVRLLFDPPQNSFLVENIRKQIEELEWRLLSVIENKQLVASKEVTIDEEL